MRPWDASAIEALIAAGVPESASLEYKSDLHLSTNGEKTEVAKDLTSIGNGGGGTVLFGVDEDTKDWPAATATAPLTDPSLLSRLENILQDGVRPPLVVSFTRIDVDGGHVLAAEVEPSPLGPYMVELYGERRFHIRDGNRTRRMTETEVSQAYALAARSADQHAKTWAAHALPMSPPTEDVWLTISGIPQAPLSDVIDLSALEPADLQPPTEPTVYLNEWSLADMTDLFRSMTRWADGFHAEAGAGPNGQPGRQIRIHRDGAVGLALQIETYSADPSPVSLIRVSRILNGALIYLGWLWNHLGVRRPIELRIRMHRCDVARFQVDLHDAGTVVQPVGMNIETIDLEHMLGIDELTRAGCRHLLGMRFTDRAAQAFGYRKVQYPYRWGELYGPHGHPLGMCVGEREIHVDKTFAATIHTGGLVVCGHTGTPVSSFNDGVLSDDAGHVLGVLELAPGSACPDDFIAVKLEGNPAGVAARMWAGDRDPFILPTEMPPATPVWSTKDAREHIRGF